MARLAEVSVDYSVTSDADRAAKLYELGAYDDEVERFLSEPRVEDEWLLSCLVLIKLDRFGKRAESRRQVSVALKKRMLDPSYRLENATRARLWAALKGKTKGSGISRLAFSISDLRDHLERQFLDGMSWANYGKWHVDHIRPCSAFDQTNPEQFRACWSLENLQPLWARDNIRKGGHRVSP